MKCPICAFARLPDDAAAWPNRCPNCQQTLTTWKNFRLYGRQAYEAGLHALTQERAAEAIELFLRAVVFTPDEPAYLDAYGRMLGQMGRYQEAAVVLRHACEVGANAQAALDKAEALADQPAPFRGEPEAPGVTEAGASGSPRNE